MSGHDEGHAGFDSVAVARVALRERFLHRLLPVLACIDSRGSDLTAWERFRAVRFAVDMSLALTAAGAVNWSHALARNLSQQLSSGVEKDCEARVGEHASIVAEQMAMANWFPTTIVPMPRRSVPKQQRRVFAGLNAARRRRRRWSGHKRRQVRSFDKALSWRRAFIKSLGLHTARRRYEPTVAKASAAQMSDFEPLQKIIPGGRQLMDPATLLDEAANYILSLQVQVEALNTLAEAAVHRSSS